MHSAALPLLAAAAGMFSFQPSWFSILPPTVDKRRFGPNNQRQIRKNRRRANAAGVRNAFV